MNPDPRTERAGICGVTHICSRIEWVCILEVHDKVYQGKGGRVILSNNPTSFRHYFVNKWPNRPTSEEDSV